MLRDQPAARESAVPRTSPRITDLRVAVVTDAPFRCPIIRIDTDQGLFGLGEVRDSGSPTYALMLKSRLLGENPLNVERLFRKLRQFGGHSRQGGGVCAVEMALWDIVGKYYDVPCYQLLGGQYRDRIRCYADTTIDLDPTVTIRRLKERLARGFTFLKVDVGVELLHSEPGLITRPAGVDLGQRALVPHQFTGAELSQRGIDKLVDHVRQIRDGIGYEVPLAIDHFGHFGLNSAIRLGRALEPYNPAWIEDLIPWYNTDQWVELTRAVALPTCTGEDIYLKEGFLELLQRRAVDIVHPDLATSGGLLETKRIGDLAQDYGVPMALHFAGSPVSCFANVHCAAATENVLALEQHAVDIPWWDDLVEGVPKPIVGADGHVAVPDGPGLGIELNLDILADHCLGEPFAPTPEWDAERSWDRLWS